MNHSKKLTEIKIWNEAWANLPLPQVLKSSANPYYFDLLDALFHRYLPSDARFEFLDIGCAPGRWLHYFWSKFGYKVSGIDNSPVGIEITSQNLTILGVQSQIYSLDVLQFKSDKRYDVVFSFGVVEHFLPPYEIIDKHIELTKKGGYVVIGVPNIKKAIYGPLQWMVNRENLNGYIHISDEDLATYLKEKLQILYCGYVGVLCFYLLNIHPKRKILLRIVNTIQFLLDKILRAFRVTKETKKFSPYIFIIGKKL